VSQNPRVVLADTYVQWGVASTPPLFTRRGTV
jgi:hypothetical protein